MEDGALAVSGINLQHDNWKAVLGIDYSTPLLCAFIDNS